MLALSLRRIPFSEGTRRRLTAKARADAGPAHRWPVRLVDTQDPRTRRVPDGQGRRLPRLPPRAPRPPPRPPPPRRPPVGCIAIIASDVSHETNDEDRPYEPRPRAQAMAFDRLYRRIGPRIRPGSAHLRVFVGFPRPGPQVLADPGPPRATSEEAAGPGPEQKVTLGIPTALFLRPDKRPRGPRDQAPLTPGSPHPTGLRSARDGYKGKSEALSTVRYNGRLSGGVINSSPRLNCGTSTSSPNGNRNPTCSGCMSKTDMNSIFCLSGFSVTAGN